MKNSFFLSILALMLVFVGCKDEVDPAAQPKVSVTAGEATVSTLTFKVTPQDAEACSYVCIEATAAAPTAEAILNEGTAVDAAKESTNTVKDLKAATEYSIYAAVRNGELTAMSAKVSMTTAKEEGEGPDEPDQPDQPTAKPSVEVTVSDITEDAAVLNITPKDAEKCTYLWMPAGEVLPTPQDLILTGNEADAAKGGQYKMMGLKENSSYVAVVAVKNDKEYAMESVEFTTKERVANVTEYTLTAGLASVVDEHVVTILSNNEVSFNLDFYTGTKELLEGRYNLSDKLSGKCLNIKQTYLLQNDQKKYFASGYAEVKVNGKSCDIAIEFVDEIGDITKAAFSGEIEYQEEGPGVDPDAIPFEIAYFGVYEDEGTFSFTIYDEGMATYMGQIYLHGTKEDIYLHPGQYVAGNDLSPFTFDGNSYISFWNPYEYIMLEGGTIDVALVGHVYTVVFNVVGNNGNKYGSKYVGEIPGMEFERVYGTLEPTTAEWLTSDTPIPGKFVIQMSDASNSYVFKIDFNVDESNTYLPAGKYDWVSMTLIKDGDTEQNPRSLDRCKAEVLLEGDVYTINFKFKDCKDNIYYSGSYTGKIKNMVIE